MFDFNNFKKMLSGLKIPENMIDRGIIGLKNSFKEFERLLTQQRIPDNGLTDEEIREILFLLAQMDSSNDKKAFRIGEREARISNPLLYEFSAGFLHGIGRSGDIKAPQPKATGATILNLLTDKLVLNLIKELGLDNIDSAMTVPLGTGMSIMLTLRGLIKWSEDSKANDSERTEKGEKTEKTSVSSMKKSHNKARSAGGEENSNSDFINKVNSDFNSKINNKNRVTFEKGTHNMNKNNVQKIAKNETNSISSKENTDIAQNDTQNKLENDAQSKLQNDTQNKLQNDTQNVIRNEIIVPRMDHKSPIKGVELAGLKPVIIQSELGHRLNKTNQLSQKEVKHLESWGLDAVYVPIDKIQEAINPRTLGILSTNSFFPPRAPDFLKKIAKIAEDNEIFHIINNAYGIQSPALLKHIKSAIDAGRVDAVIQSTDKNFLTPVGGAVICAPNKSKLHAISSVYAGRANSAPILHLFTSLLSMGLNGYKELIEQQQANRKLLRSLLKELAQEINEKILDVNNPIACIMTLDNLDESKIERLGGYLYNLRVTGPRVVNPNKKKFGPSHPNYPHAYIVMNAAIGSRRKDIEGAVSQLRKALKQL